MLVRLPLPLTPTLFPYTTLFRSVETEELLHPGNLLGPQFGAVSRPGALFIGRGPADDGPQGDEGGLVGDALGLLDRLVQGVDVLEILIAAGPVDALGVPAVGLVAGHDILGECHVGRSE